jgi:beta-lactamase regulating signal transducer with metallopeptidase domain
MNPFAEAVSAALIHFVWQALVVAALLWFILGLMRRSSANARYLVACAGLATLAALPILTFSWLYAGPRAIIQPVLLSSGASVFSLNQGISDGRVSNLLPFWILRVWLAGVLIFSVRMAWGCRQISALRRRGSAADGETCAIITNLARRMGLNRPVRTLVSALANGPSVIGWLRPVLLIPAATLAGLTPEQLDAVLAHELAHIRRYDYLVNLLQMAVEALLFYHPAVWWISTRIRQERELCCDDVAVQACGNPLVYARALAALEKLRPAIPAMAMNAAGAPLLYRIQRLVGVRAPDPRLSPWPIALMLIAGIVGFGLNGNWARGQAQVPTQAKPPAPPVSRPVPQEKAVARRRVTKKIKAPEPNPWISQIIVQKPEPPKPDAAPDVLPAELSSALKVAEYAAGWELGYLMSAHGDNGTGMFARSTAIDRDLMRLKKEAADAPSPEARETIFAELRSLLDELRRINEQLREARHNEGETRDPQAGPRFPLN